MRKRRRRLLKRDGPPSRRVPDDNVIGQGVQNGGRVLALDVGEARIGLAVSDPTGLLTTPLSALRRVKAEKDVDAVLEVAQREGVGSIVVGLPLSMSGRRSQQTRVVLSFADALKAKSPIPVELWDERLSTTEAEALLRSAGVEPSRDRARLDSAAAAVILRWYLDARSGKRTGSTGYPDC